MKEEIIARIDKKMDAIIRLLASEHIEGKNKTAAIKSLAALGLEPTLIAEIANTSPGMVYARLSEARKSKGKGKKAKKVEANE